MLPPTWMPTLQQSWSKASRTVSKASWKQNITGRGRRCPSRTVLSARSRLCYPKSMWSLVLPRKKPSWMRFQRRQIAGSESPTKDLTLSFSLLLDARRPYLSRRRCSEKPFFERPQLQQRCHLEAWHALLQVDWHGKVSATCEFIYVCSQQSAKQWNSINPTSQQVSITKP